MAPQKPVFSEIKNKSTANTNSFSPNFVNPIDSSTTKSTAPKVVTNFKKKIWIIVAIILIFVLAITTIIIVVKPDKENTIKDISIKLSTTKDATGNDLLDIGFNFDNFDENRVYVDNNNIKHIKLMPGDDFSGNLALTSLVDPEKPNSAGDVVVRCRVYALVENRYVGNIFKYTVNANNSEDWFLSDLDGYVYYNDLLSPNNTIRLNLNVKISGAKTTNEFQGKSMSLFYCFEVLQASADQSIRELWFSSPYAWRISIAKKVLNSK